MRNMLCTIVLIGLTVGLFGCNGASKNSGNNDNSIAQTAQSVDISLLNDTQQQDTSFVNNENITVIAKLLDTFNQPISGKIVTFTTSLGSFSNSTALTNANGLATTTLSAEDILGAASITATYEGISSSANFELIAPDVSESDQLRLSVAMVVNTVSSNHLSTTETASISAQLSSSNGALVANQIIDFTAELGQLTPSSALTNNLGVATVTLTPEDESIGAGQITATLRTNELDSAVITQLLNYQIVENETLPSDIIRLGHFDINNQFIEGELGLVTADNSTSINAGASLGIDIALVDSSGNRVMTPYQISFTSNCFNNGKANLDTTKTTVNGIAQATFEDLGCSGNQSIDDVITASVTINNEVQNLTGNFTIQAEQLGAIEFISAEPASLVLQGTGGVNQKETTTLTFKVTGELGNPLANQKVDFKLNSDLGGLSISHASSFTNTDGLVTTRVSSGNVPAVVRVSASTSTDNKQIATLSDLLTVNTGLPDQNSITISPATINVEAHDINGVKNTISVFLADSFNNPVVDGTTVNFTTEGGQIEPSCTTISGVCTVEWTSSEPRVPNHRITILATAVGHETFFDTNGNNIFDSEDGEAILDAGVDSGLVRTLPASSGFMDMSEAWLDDDEDARYDSGEVFLDLNNSGTYNPADGKFNGPQCTGSKCSATSNTINIRKSAVIIMASSSAQLTVTSGSSRLISVNSPLPVTGASPNIEEGTTRSFTLTYMDTADQILAAGTTVSISSDVGELSGNTNLTVANSLGRATPLSNLNNTMNFTLKNTNDPNEPDDETLSGFVTVTVASPSGVVTESQFSVILEGN